METISKHNILNWEPSRQSPKLIKARKRISGEWSHNRFFNYKYEPSPEYFQYTLKHKITAYKILTNETRI